MGDGALGEEQRAEITRLLQELNKGSPEAMERLLDAVYRELRRLAARYLSRERGDHTLQPTAVVHEAYLRLVDQRQVVWQNRAHFLGVAATMMRRVLIDYAKARQAARRGGGGPKVELDESMAIRENRVVEVLAVDQALERLAALDAGQARVVELRYFGGLSVEETAEVLRLSPATVKRYWTSARAWLHRELSGDKTGDARAMEAG